MALALTPLPKRAADYFQHLNLSHKFNQSRKLLSASRCRSSLNLQHLHERHCYHARCQAFPSTSPACNISCCCCSSCCQRNEQVFALRLSPVKTPAAAPATAVCPLAASASASTPAAEASREAETEREGALTVGAVRQGQCLCVWGADQKRCVHAFVCMCECVYVWVSELVCDLAGRL